jgi:hypothetical protein
MSFPQYEVARSALALGDDTYTAVRMQCGEQSPHSLEIAAGESASPSQ